ncbi:MAG: type II toxin-antitoxin system HicB family antitoxin [Fimbriimonadaceae bacterium]
MTYIVQLIPEDEGGYSVLVPGLPGCVSQGETREEALVNIQEAIQLYLEVLNEANEGMECASVNVELKIA